MNQYAQERYEIRVGVFTIAAMIMFLFGWGWLKSISWFHTPQRFTIQFHDIAGLNRNAPVNINGMRVGIVEDVELKAKGQVLVHPRITAPNVVVPVGSAVTIQTLGLVGAKYLEVTLPEVKPGQPSPAALGPDDVVIGEDPVRTELVINQVASLVKQMVGSGKGKTLASNLSQAVTSINHLAGRIDGSLDHFQDAADNISTVSEKFGNLADSVNATTGDAKSFFVQGKQTMQNVSGLTTDLRGTDQKLNRLLEHPNISSDLKEVIDKAQKTSQQIAAAVDQLNKTFGNDTTRQDLITVMNRLSDSTKNIAHSLDTINSMSKDQDLRNDLKAIIAQARTAMDKVNSVMGEKGFGTDLHDTVLKVKSAATNVDIASQQLQEALGHKHPMMHLMFGKGIKAQPKSTSGRAQL